jgi:hypothetical protein
VIFWDALSISPLGKPLGGFGHALIVGRPPIEHTPAPLANVK